MTTNKNFLKALSIIFPLGLMFSSPVNAEMIRNTNTDEFTQFGMKNPQCDGLNVYCFGFPLNSKLYYSTSADYCIREDNAGRCAEKGTVLIHMNDEEYIKAINKFVEIQSKYDKKYKNREEKKVIGYSNCQVTYVTLDDGVTVAQNACNSVVEYDTYTTHISTGEKTWKTQTGFGLINFPVTQYARCENTFENQNNNPGVYIEGIGCSGSVIREFSPTIAECEKCDPKAMIDQLAIPIIPSYPSNQKGNGGISIASGEKFESKIDIEGPIKFTRLYSSKYNKNGTLGIGWRHNYDKRLVLIKSKNVDATTPEYVTSLRFILENNEDIIFQRSGVNEQFYPIFNNQKNYKLINDTNTNTYILVGPNGIKETYNYDGQLIKITEVNGAWKSFTYTNSKLTQITNQYGQYLNISYAGDLVERVEVSSGDFMAYSYQDGLLKYADFNGREIFEYGYTDKLLSSITNSNFNKYVEFYYNPDNGKAIGSKNIVNGNYINNIDITYDVNTGNVSVNNDGVNNYYSFKNDDGVNKVVSADIAGLSQYNLINTGGITSSYNKDGATSTFGYDTNNRLNRITNRATSGNLNTNYTWNDSNQIASSSETSANGTRNVTLERDNHGNITKRTISTPTGNRVFSYTYTTFGRVLTMTEPNGAITTYTYYPTNDVDISRRGQLHTIKNALGHTITINAYNPNGMPTKITGANGTVKDITYDYRNKVLTETVFGLTTRYRYNGHDKVYLIIYPDNSIMNYSYNELGQLIGEVEVSSGGYKQITLDAKGNPIAENLSVNGQTIANYNRSFDSINRITSMWRDNSSEAESYTYDSRGDMDSTTNAINQTTSYVYDNLKRVTSSTENAKTKEFTYDNDSNLTGVSINYQKTSYSYNDFAELLSINSPDTGTTSFEYNIAARETKKTDSDGTQHIYKKDLLGRVIQINHTNPQAVENFTYDTNGIGQLATVADSSGTTSFNYDNLSRLTKKTQVVNGMSKSLNYTYNNVGQLEKITYPSGAVVNYTYTQGKITNINVNDNPLIADITYYPFTNNPISWHLGLNGMGGYIIKTFDLNGKLTNFKEEGLLEKTITMNGIYNITEVNKSSFYPGISDINISANYNDNNQIINVDINGENKIFEFDNNMNLKKKAPYSFNYETNKIYNLVKDTGGFGYFFYDGRGNVKRNDRGDFTYDSKNNLISSNTGLNATYKFNAFNQRVSKTVDGETTYFMYDGDRLIGEYDVAGNVIMEHIYMGDLPVAVLKNNQMYNVHTDEIGTPRLITDSNRSIMWKWVHVDIYGSNEAVTNYNFNYNLRFAGQYFDFENGLHYNFNRTYDPQTGRYMQSDPIGLNGGDHTYNYVNGNPLNMIDPDGLDIVYYYQPVGQFSNYSHAAIGSTKSDKVISLMPTKAEPNILFGGEGRVTIESKLAYEGMSEKFLIKANQEQEDMIMNLIQNGEHPYQYSYTNINGDNCAGWVHKVLDKAGIKIGLPGIKFLTPYALYNGIEQYNKLIKVKGL